jgi:pimeloyl-ACP methyl ester carboxylesterase
MKILKNFSIQGKHQKPIVTDVFYNETQQLQKVIIFCHGYKGFKDWGAWNLMAESFANAGYFFIKFNFSHNGGTLEQPIDFTDLEAFGNNNYTKELDDLESVIDWISTNPQFNNIVDTDQISIIGHSRGGGIATIKAAEDTRVKNLISLAAVCDFASRSSTSSDISAWKKTGVKYVSNGRTKQQMPHFYQFHENFIQNKDRLNIKISAKKIAIPHLIIHGDNDTSISVTEGEKLHTWNPKSVFKIIENANHVFNVSHPWAENRGSEAFEKTIKSCIDFLKQ